MAFVYETERSKLFNQNKTTQDLGPGQYLPLTEFKFQNPEVVPFGVSTFRKFPEEPTPYPGPGSYYHDVDKEKNEKILKNTLKNYIAKEDEINISSKGIAKFEPKKGEQERAIKKCKDNYEILGFNSKVKRFATKDRKKTPGPGTYSDKNFKEAKSLEKKCNDTKATIFKINCDRNSVFQVDKNELSSLNFNKNVFPEKYKDNKDIKKNKKTKNKSTKKEIKKRLEEEQKEIKNELKYRVSSIPSKNYKGYIEEESTGKLVRKKNPEAFKIFSGDKDDAVGPGSYEIIFPEDWKKTGTSWSKYKWEKDPKKIRPKSSFNVNNINCEIGNFRKKKPNYENNKVNKEMSNYYKSYTTKQLNYKDPTAHNIETITEVIKKRKLPAFIPMNNVPGPGYYYDSHLMNGMRRASARPIKEKKPYNLEDEILNELFSNKNNNKEEGIIYDFKKEQAENFKKKILEKIKHKDIPFLSKSERFNLEPYTRTKSSISSKNKNQLFNNQNKKKKNLMKGVKVQNNRITESDNYSNDISYYSSTNNSSTNNINLFYSRPNSMSGLFYRKDIRFRERQIEEDSKKYVPGPGSYINPFTGTGKTNSIQINGRYMDLKTCIKYIENNRFNNIRPKTAKSEIKFQNYISENKNPGVGSYEPERIYTVKNDIIRKMNQGNKTFNSTLLSDRNAIYQFQKNAPNGPGTYFVDSAIVNVTQNYNAFNVTSLRFEKGGKYNTKDILEEINDHKVPLNAIISTFVAKDDNENIKNMGDTNRNSYEIKMSQKKSKKSNSYLNKNIKKKNIGPGTYDYTSERFPWVKPSFNVKYI